MNGIARKTCPEKTWLCIVIIIVLTSIQVASASNAANFRIMPIWFGDSNQGGGAAIGNIDDNESPDVAILNIDDPGDQNIPYLRFGFNLNSEGYTDDWTKEVRIPIWMGEETAAADIAFADINNNGRPDLVLFNIDNAEGENHAYYCIGWDLTMDQGDKNEKTVDITWDSHATDPIPIPGWTGEDTDGGGIALADLNGNNIKDFIVFHIDDRSDSSSLFSLKNGENNDGYYKIGWDMDENGEVTWNTASRTTDPFSVGSGRGIGEETEGGDIAVSDLNNNEIPDLIVYYVDNPEGENVGYLLIGWDVCTNNSCLGTVQKWDEPIEIPGWFGEVTTGASIDVLNTLPNGGSNGYIFRVGKDDGSGGFGIISPDIKGLKGIYSLFPMSFGGTTSDPSPAGKSEQSIPPESTGIPAQGSSSTHDLNGVWNCDDNGKYYIVQSGENVYWYGEEKELDPNWSNIAFGTINGDMVTLTWTDVPKGKIKQNGELLLKITGSQGSDSSLILTSVSKTGNFGGSTWTRAGATTGENSCTDPSMELNTDRPGKDYRSFELEEPNPCDCMYACTQDSGCRAYTYVKPGVQSEKANCWLKNGIPDPVPNTNCISGGRNISEPIYL